ncbi:hypothetical protein EYF80_051270 [Liparis tanakae]|uniref:Uncharacterized protein n=1 Tax=Liparis tanakae TaxID=230148 RepID=A0A4Z2FCC3_9TELE|nr:hypothetical protein EYF80_051270 [Liparis tanakae]
MWSGAAATRSDATFAHRMSEGRRKSKTVTFGVIAEFLNERRFINSYSEGRVQTWEQNMYPQCTVALNPPPGINR